MSMARALIGARSLIAKAEMEVETRRSPRAVYSMAMIKKCGLN